MVLLPAWKKTPFLRLLLPFIAGIIIQWYGSISLQVIISLLLVSFLIFLSGFWTDYKSNFKWRTLFGFSLQLLFISAGMFISWLNNIKNDTNWIGNFYEKNDVVEVRLTEPLSEKQNSFKANAVIQYIFKNGHSEKVAGNVLIYFEKDSSIKNVHYGSTLQFSKQLQLVKNSGNPGAFNYSQYCAFRDIYHQVYLKKNEYYNLKKPYPKNLTGVLWKFRHRVIELLRENLKGKDETAIAEALLIGYRDDLDKDLVQSYSNTGVVHIIAISGLHLGLIYGLLVFLFKPLQKRKNLKSPVALIILTCLWMFSLIAGAAPSVLRSAVMFSFLVIGGVITKANFRFNTLAASAFFLLCINPFYLWDVGFQLSYAAVLSIMLFMRPIYNWLIIQNKLLDGLWKITSVTLSAQIFTLPLCVYHFHQVPNLFLVANLVVVPIGSIILYGELLICCLGVAGIGVKWLGLIVSFLLHWMNEFIQWINKFSFAVTDNILVNIPQTLLIYFTIICFNCWLLLQWKKFRIWSFIFLLSFFVLRSVAFYYNSAQKRVVVYNVPDHSAIDFINGSAYRFYGDSVMLQDGFLRNFHLKPARISNQTTLAGYIDRSGGNDFITYAGKNFLLLRREELEIFLDSLATPIDYIILSNNPNLHIKEIKERFSPAELIFDGSNKWWKIQQWKNECEILHLRCHSTPDEGAFVLDL